MFWLLSIFTPEALGEERRQRHQPNKGKREDRDRALKALQALQKMRAKITANPRLIQEEKTKSQEDADTERPGAVKTTLTI